MIGWTGVVIVNFDSKNRTLVRKQHRSVEGQWYFLKSHGTTYIILEYPCIPLNRLGDIHIYRRIIGYIVGSIGGNWQCAAYEVRSGHIIIRSYDVAAVHISFFNSYFCAKGYCCIADAPPLHDRGLNGAWFNKFHSWCLIVPRGRHHLLPAHHKIGRWLFLNPVDCRGHLVRRVLLCTAKQPAQSGADGRQFRLAYQSFICRSCH